MVGQFEIACFQILLMKLFFLTFICELRMRCDCYDCNCVFGRAVMPKNPVGCRRLILSICLKNFLAVNTLQAQIFMCPEATVTWICCQ